MNIKGPIIKTEMLIGNIKGNLDMTILPGKITHHLDPEIGKMLEPMTDIKAFSIVTKVKMKVMSKILRNDHLCKYEEDSL